MCVQSDTLCSGERQNEQVDFERLLLATLGDDDKPFIVLSFAVGCIIYTFGVNVLFKVFLLFFH